MHGSLTNFMHLKQIQTEKVICKNILIQLFLGQQSYSLTFFAIRMQEKTFASYTTDMNHVILTTNKSSKFFMISLPY